jgi:hypothetical protein
MSKFMKKTKEVWKDVVGFEGLYEISNIGNVRINKCVAEQKRAAALRGKTIRGGAGSKTPIERIGENLPLRKSNMIPKSKSGLPKVYSHILLFKDGGRKDEYVHRMVAKAFIPMPQSDKKLIVDHWDGNTLNNVVDNLRWVTQSQNGMNSRKCARKTSSKYKGVCLIKTKDRSPRWLAKFSLPDGQGSMSKTFPIGAELQAAKWYDEQVLLHHGEYALLNIRE